jgi:hypothetical protein
MIKDLITPLMEDLVVAAPPQRLVNSSYGYFSIRDISRRVLNSEFTLLLGKDPLSVLLGFAANMSVLWEHASLLVALRSDPSELAIKLLGSIAGVDISTRGVSPESWPSVNEAAADLWRGPLYVYHPSSMDIQGLDRLVKRVRSRGVIDLFVDSPCDLRLNARKASTPADFPEVCQALCGIARNHGGAVLAAHPSTLKLADAALLADSVVRFEDFGDSARVGWLRRGETRPSFQLARCSSTGRYNDVIKMPWDSTTGRRFHVARST